MLLECGRRASTVVLRLNVRIFLKRRGLKLEIKGRLVYIPTYSPTQHISFDTTDQFYERWSGEELVKFKHFSDVYSNCLDLSIGSIAPRQSRSRRLRVYFPLEHLSHPRAEKQAAAAACWEPKMSYKQHNTWPSETDNLWTVTTPERLDPPRLIKTCRAKQAGV